MVLFDATMISLWLYPGAKSPTDANGKPIANAQDKVDCLVETLSKSRTKIVIPSPALAEFLVLVGAAGPKYMEAIRDKSCFSIADFDTRAAIETAVLLRAILNVGKKNILKDTTWAKVKFDHQIVAIAKVVGVSTIYSDDKQLATYAKAQGIETQGINDLPKPPMKQIAMELDEQSPLRRKIRSIDL